MDMRIYALKQVLLEVQILRDIVRAAPSAPVEAVDLNLLFSALKAFEDCDTTKAGT